MWSYVDNHLYSILVGIYMHQLIHIMHQLIHISFAVNIGIYGEVNRIFFNDTHRITFIWVLTSFGWAGFDYRVGNALLSPCDQCCLLGRGWLDLDVIGWGVGTGAGGQGGGTADRAQYGDTVRGLDRKCRHLGQVSSPWRIGGSLKGKVFPMKEKGKQAHMP